MMKIETKLARVFTAIAGDEQRIESTAASVLQILKSEGVTKVEDFNAAVKLAYEANGWHTKPGRPQNGDAAGSVPATVRTYVSWVRGAMNAGLRIGRFETFQDLRKALAKKRGGHLARGGNAVTGAVKIPEDIVESFRGVHIADAEPNGGLFHDLALVYLKLDVNERGLYGRQLNKLLGQYRAHAFPTAVARHRAAAKKAAA